MKNKLRQFYSILLNKRTNVFIALTLSMLIVGAILSGGLLMNLFGGKGFTNLTDAVYSAMLMVIDPGFLAVDSGFAVGLTSLLVVIFGMVVFLGGSIGYVSSILSNFMESVRGGDKKVFLYNHILILNWNPRALDIFTEECYRGEVKNMLIFVREGREEIRQQIRARRAQLKKEGGDYRPVNCFVREGDLFSVNGLLDVGVERATTIIVLDDEDSCRGTDSLASMTPIKILMLLSKMKLDKKQSVIVEAVDQWNKHLIDDIEAEARASILGVSTNELLGKMLAQISIMPEINRVYGELMSHRGSEFYSLPSSYPADDKYTGIEEFMADHAHCIPLNIMDMEGQSYLFTMGENEQSTHQRGGKAIQPVALQVNGSYTQPQRNVVIIGKNSKQNYLFDCYAEYVIEHGEQCLHIDRISTEEGLEMVRDRKYITEHVIGDDYDKQGIQTHLKAVLAAKRVDTILLLSNDMDDSHSLDTEVLVDLIHVKRILAETGSNPELVVEILDPRHLDIANGYGIKSIVFSNQYVSRLITQFGDRRSLYVFFSDLFSYDTDGEAVAKKKFRSKEIYIRTAGEVYQTMPPPLSQRELIVATYYSSPKENPLILLGYIPADTQKLTLFRGDMDQNRVTITPEDKLVIYCRH